MARHHARPALWAESYYNDVAQCCDSSAAGGADERDDSVSPLMQVVSRERTLARR